MMLYGGEPLLNPNIIKAGRYKCIMNDLVSIIMPVYNTIDYLDESVGSLINQTYSNIEIIIVDDGSTDGSYEKCLTFAQEDGRIKVYKLNHGGQGPARNFGVRVAKGTWIAFIDSDDWYDLDYVKIMLKTAMSEKADLVTCNGCKVPYGIGEKQPWWCSEVIGIPLSREQKLIKDLHGIVTKFSKKELWIKYGIEQPPTRGQDFAVNMLLEAVAKKMVCINDEFYFYRKARPNATTTGNTTNRKDVAISAKCLVDGFKRNGLYEEYKDILYRHIAREFSLVLSAGNSNLDEVTYLELKKTFIDFMHQEFGDYSSYEIVHVGSFNLMRIIREMPYVQDTNLSFQFSSIISIVNPIEDEIEVNHKNKFRKKMIEKDIKSDFGRKISNCDYLVWDFLEERYGVIKIGQAFCTNSDALKQADITVDGDKVEFGTEEWKNLWFESFKQFMGKLFNIIPADKVIVVKNILATQYGNVNKLSVYKEKENIHYINQILKWCYEVAEREYPQISFIDINDCMYYFTDEKYEYGAYPWHLNEYVNEEIAKKIYGEIIIHK